MTNAPTHRTYTSLDAAYDHFNRMLFGGELATLGAILPISIVSGLILGIIAYMAQRKWYGDDKDSAIIKALILAFLTAIPTPLPAILYVPSGIVGLIHKLRGK